MTAMSEKLPYERPSLRVVELRTELSFVVVSGDIPEIPWDDEE